ncbi:butyrophilin subfamily 3 member A1-like [Emydura macquarii macquarii]|uniref:butyrophilin subfamily 3 member A1-like n=1 Tax=Emydura macquarii macquarii TaxID=1129001 RepID=UPI00352BA8C8
MLGVRRPRSNVATISAVLLLLHVQAAAAVSFQVLAPAGPISAPLGGTVVLPCHLSPALSAQAMQVKWSRPQLGQDVLVYRPDGSEVQGMRYQGRTKLLRDGMQSGGVALRLWNLTLWDEGRYLCDFQSNATVSNATLELQVMNSGSDPLLHLGGYDGKKINVTCLSAGWYPKPEVLWQNSSGERVTPSEEKIFPSNQGLFNVSSQVVVDASSDPMLICTIKPGSLGPEKISTILISDVFFPRVSSWKVGLFLFLLVCVCHLFFLAFYLWSVQRAKRKTSSLTTKKWTEIGSGLSEPPPVICGRLLSEQPTPTGNDSCLSQEQRFSLKDPLHTAACPVCGWLVSHCRAHLTHILAVCMGSSSVLGYPKMKVYREKEDVILDPDTAHPSLSLSKDRRHVTVTNTSQALANNPGRFDIYSCVLGSDGYLSGTHYWDVEVAGAEGWALGVTRESASRKGWFNFCPEQGTWAIQLSMGQYREVTAEWSPLHPPQSPGTIRVYLDYEGGVVCFYDANTMAPIHAFTTSFTGKIYPFFWVWSVGTSLRLCPTQPSNN